MSAISTGLRFHCEYSLYLDSYSLHIASLDWVAGEQTRAYAKPLEFEAAQAAGLVAPFQPALTFRDGEAQALIDTLWSAGLRPTQGKQSEGVTAAQDRHLQDMRALAFAKLGVERP